MEAPDTTDEPDAQALAQACADSMWRDDRASKALGMTIQRIGAGEAALKAGRGGIYDVTVRAKCSYCGTSRTLANHCRRSARADL
ncbi:hypothetical protein [Bradyrhizobium sediminis]|uniref:hypothetical protein n=1 Tax=Bradyrhizobium sediminis TaxID=2840469 RepID=UPI00352BF1AD